MSAEKLVVHLALKKVVNLVESLADLLVVKLVEKKVGQ